MSAPQLLVDSIRNAPSDVVLVATGPLSNVAGALRLDAGRSPATALSDHLGGVYVMGGAVRVPGNLCCTTTAGFDGSQELNMWIDPPAASSCRTVLPPDGPHHRPPVEACTSGSPPTGLPSSSTSSTPSTAASAARS